MDPQRRASMAERGRRDQLAIHLGERAGVDAGFDERGAELGRVHRSSHGEHPRRVARRGQPRPARRQRRQCGQEASTVHVA